MQSLQSMQSGKRAFVALFLAGSLFGAPAAHAGIPVIDVASLVEAIMQVLSWVNQAEQMVQTIEQAEQQIEGIGKTVESLANARNLGTILNDPNIRGVLPDEMRDANALMNGAYSSTRMDAINGTLSAFGVQSTINGASVNGIRNSADSLAKMQQLLASTQQRNQQVAALADRVDSSADAKDSMDLMNRNVIEATRVNNDMLAAMAAIEADKQAAQLRDVAEVQQHLATFRADAIASARAQGY